LTTIWPAFLRFAAVDRIQMAKCYEYFYDFYSET